MSNNRIAHLLDCPDLAHRQPRLPSVNVAIRGAAAPNTCVTYLFLAGSASVSARRSALAFVYNGADQLKSASTSGSSNQPAVELTYGYFDRNGNRTVLADSISGGSFVEYQIRAFDQLAALLLPGFGSNITFGYDNLNRRTSMALPNGTTTNYTYDAASQLTNLTHRLAAATPFTSFNYLYDNVGNRTANNQQRSAVTVAPTLDYLYDDLYRLTQATNPLPALPDESFSYDPLGNRQNNNSVYDDANRLISNDEFNYVYDDNGNLIQKTDKATTDVTDYVYDAENQLIEIKVNNATIATYRYDGLGRRIEKVASGSTTRYVYDNEDILFEFDGSNNVLARYVHGPGIDEPLIMERGGSNFYYHADSLDTIMDLTDSSGAIAQSYIYDSFGQIITQGSGLVNPYTFTGREYDSESNLYFYRARYYDPSIGRFISEDPIGFESGDENFYTYASNNPINSSDPTGLITVEECERNRDAELQACIKFLNPQERGACESRVWANFFACITFNDDDDDDGGGAPDPTPSPVPVPPGTAPVPPAPVPVPICPRVPILISPSSGTNAISIFRNRNS